MDELKGLAEVFQLGGNSAAIVAVYLAWKGLTMLREAIDRNTRAVGALQRAVSVLDPESARIINGHEREEDLRLQSKT